MFKGFWEYLKEKDAVLSGVFTKLEEDRAAWKEEGGVFTYDVQGSPIIKVRMDVLFCEVTCAEKVYTFGLFFAFFLAPAMSDLLYPDRKLSSSGQDFRSATFMEQWPNRIF